eukprot:2538657-Amphidinium_carterae.1
MQWYLEGQIPGSHVSDGSSGVVKVFLIYGTLAGLPIVCTLPIKGFGAVPDLLVSAFHLSFANAIMGWKGSSCTFVGVFRLVSILSRVTWRVQKLQEVVAQMEVYSGYDLQEVSHKTIRLHSLERDLSQADCEACFLRLSADCEAHPNLKEVEIPRANSSRTIFA